VIGQAIAETRPPIAMLPSPAGAAPEGNQVRPENDPRESS